MRENMDPELRGIMKIFALGVTLILSATAISSAAVIITEQQKRTPPADPAALIERAVMRFFGEDVE